MKFKGKDLVQEEYEALIEIAAKHSKRKVEQYFSVTNSRRNSYIEISNGHVTRIDLDRQGFYSIPEELKVFQKLQVLCLEYNNISRIEGLQNPELEEIVIGWNRLKSMDDIVGRNLQTVHLGNNRITEVPDLSHLPKLNFLNVTYNPLDLEKSQKNLDYLIEKGARVYV